MVALVRVQPDKRSSILLDVETIGTRLKKLRLTHKLTLEQAGGIAGVTRQAIAKIESGGTKEPEAATLDPLARYYGVNLQWILTGKGAEHSASKLASHVLRPDPAILVQTQEFLEAAFALQGKEFSMRRDADLFADAYEYLAEDDRPVDTRNLADFGRWYAARQAKGESDAESRSLAGKATGKDRRRA